MDPAFEGRGYPEHGTTGYDGKGWYYFYGGQLWGPFDGEEQAKYWDKRLKKKSPDIDEWENEGGS
jgi:hypothetical protein